MTTYDDNLLGSAFRGSLRPSPFPGSWDDVLDRAGAARKVRRTPGSSSRSAVGRRGRR